MEYFVTFEDRKHRLDKKFSIYRRGRLDDYVLTDTTTNIQEVARGRTIKHMAMAEFKYPLSKFRSLRATATLLSDRVAIIAEKLILKTLSFIEDSLLLSTWPQTSRSRICQFFPLPLLSDTVRQQGACGRSPRAPTEEGRTRGRDRENRAPTRARRETRTTSSASSTQ